MAKAKNVLGDIFAKLDKLNEEAELLDKEAERVVNNNRRLLLLL